MRYVDQSTARMTGGSMGSQMLGQQAQRGPQAAGRVLAGGGPQGGGGMQPVGFIQGNLSAQIIKAPEQNQSQMMGQQAGLVGQQGLHNELRTGELAKANMRPQEGGGRGLAAQIAEQLGQQIRQGQLGSRGPQGMLGAQAGGPDPQRQSFLGQGQAQGNAFANQSAGTMLGQATGHDGATGTSGTIRDAPARSLMDERLQQEMAMRRQADAGGGGMLGGRGFFG